MALITQIDGVLLVISETGEPNCVTLTVTNNSSGTLRRVCFNAPPFVVVEEAPPGWDETPQCASCDPETTEGEFDIRLRATGQAALEPGESAEFLLCTEVEEGTPPELDPEDFEGLEVCLFIPNLPGPPCRCGFFGEQEPPVGEVIECIRVQKVYDWVMDATDTDQEICIPEGCKEAIMDAIKHKRGPLSVTCEAPEVPGTFPLIPKPQPNPEGNAICVISSNFRRIPGGNLAVIKAVFRVRPLVVIEDSDGEEVCVFRPTINLFKKVVVCLPEGLTRDNILCRITQVTCDENFIADADPDLGLQLEVNVCFEIQVEAEVKLEVLSTGFCAPRDVMDVPPISTSCPDFEFPEQCPGVFPPTNGNGNPPA